MPEHILDTIDHNAKVLLYPSSCWYSRRFQDLPYDVIILNSRDFKGKERIGKVYCLDYDNNELLGKLNYKGIKLSGVIIIRDGCVEGGNYECAISEGFFGRTMPIMADQFDLFIDHGKVPFDVPARFIEFDTPDYLVPLIRSSSPLHDVRSFHIKVFPLVEKDIKVGHIRVRIIHDSIWRDPYQSDLLIVRTRGSTRVSIPYYISGLLPGIDLSKRFVLSTRPRLRSIKDILEMSEAQRLSRLAFMPLADGYYKRIVSEIKQWEKEYPCAISFFHLNSDDLQYIRSMNTE